MGVKIIFFLFFTTITIFLKQANSQRVTFRDDYTYDETTEAFYKENKIKRLWEGAVFICAIQGAELAIPSSEEEMQALIRHMGKQTHSVWLGVHDPRITGEFFTLNGTRTELALKTHRGNTSGGKENCVAMSRNGDYNAFDCNTRRKFICKKDSASVTRNHACETYDMGYTYSAEGDRCYKVHTTPREWFTSMKICSIEGSEIVVINSAYESEIIENILKAHPEESLEGDFNKGVIHIGFKKSKKAKGFFTLDGKPLEKCGFTEWATNQPPELETAGNCGGLLRNGKLTTLNCHQKAIFICEKVLSNDFSPRFDIRFSLD